MSGTFPSGGLGDVPRLLTVPGELGRHGLEFLFGQERRFANGSGPKPHIAQPLELLRPVVRLLEVLAEASGAVGPQDFVSSPFVVRRIIFLPLS